jgi:hypothetical protein
MPAALLLETPTIFEARRAAGKVTEPHQPAVAFIRCVAIFPTYDVSVQNYRDIRTPTRSDSADSREKLLF